MTLSRLTLAAVGATSILLIAVACGGGSGDVPSGSIAVVDGTKISQDELDTLLARAKKGYASQKQDFPKVGTEEYQTLRTQYVAYLVQREQFEQSAEELGIEVTEKDIDKAVDEFVKSNFDGKRAQYEKALEQQGYTEEDFRQTIVVSVLSQKIFQKVTADVKVTAADVLAYYQQNEATYRTPESRDVRHILVAEKKGDAVDFVKSKAEADRIYAELKNGGDFAAIAKKSSADTTSAVNGGKLTISRGQTVPEFDKVAFELEQGVVSLPVKTTYGYHLIEALSPVRKAKVTPLDKVQASIRAQLLQERRTAVMTKWIEDLRSDYKDKVSYAEGYAPPELPEADTTTSDPTNQ